MDLREAAELVLRAAKRAGATDADVVAAEGESLEVAVRLGEIEKLKRARERRLALRAFTGQSSAVCSSADLAPDALERLAEETVTLARATAPDPFSGLPESVPGDLRPVELDLHDPSAATVSADEALAIARATERAALDVDPKITNSEGAEFEAGAHRICFVSSRGACVEQQTSSFGVSAAPVAVHDGRMQQDSWYSMARHRADLESAESVGKTAGHRALRRLGARSVRTCEVPVVFDPQTAATLVGHFAAAVSGTSVYRGLSFLKEKTGAMVARPEVTLIDDPLLPRKLGSRIADAEGLPSRRNVVVESGRLMTFLLDTYSARKLGLSSTASAVRALGDSPHAGSSNFYLANGTTTPDEIIASIANGFYVTALSGMGVNSVTGDYSRGAAGLWIESGRLSFPVEGVTIAGNLLHMFQGIERVGNDLRFRSRICSPTLMVESMTVAGEA